MSQLLLRLLTAVITIGLAAMVVRDFRLGRAPAVRDGFAIRYARRDEAPMLFWIFTLGRAAVIGVVALALFRLE